MKEPADRISQEAYVILISDNWHTKGPLLGSPEMEVCWSRGSVWKGLESKPQFGIAQIDDQPVPV